MQEIGVLSEYLGAVSTYCCSFSAHLKNFAMSVFEFLEGLIIFILAFCLTTLNFTGCLRNLSAFNDVLLNDVFLTHFDD